MRQEKFWFVPQKLNAKSCAMVISPLSNNSIIKHKRSFLKYSPDPFCRLIVKLIFLTWFQFSRNPLRAFAEKGRKPSGKEAVWVTCLTIGYFLSTSPVEEAVPAIKVNTNANIIWIEIFILSKRQRTGTRYWERASTKRLMVKVILIFWLLGGSGLPSSVLLAFWLGEWRR